eukprot:scaffold46125_cov37-Tisochrysis_lutea.AAC.2
MSIASANSSRKFSFFVVMTVRNAQCLDSSPSNVACDELLDVLLELTKVDRQILHNFPPGPPPSPGVSNVKRMLIVPGVCTCRACLLFVIVIVNEESVGV